ncbi:MFS transporter [Yinghuangia seranimata]|uniref:MFS transporter n=1 Tax=Yinghuangia seranimata TaxID=408067 RepID=UPI00248C469D|nr:MFS transporter [Yinghuangia seranimata]MDI2129389.1 MFS transporter [Yinghuangia seranimata]
MNSKLFDSKTLGDQVTAREKVLGFLLGPLGPLLVNAVIVSYLNVYYTDVLDLSGAWGGLFLTVFPLASRVISTASNLYIGRVIDRTVSRQGKARPWLLVSAPFMGLGIIAVFGTPSLPMWLQLAWVVLAGNLYADFAFATYNTAHLLMVPLASRDPRDRGILAVFSNVGNMVGAGTMVALVFPALVLPALGVNRAAWLFMACLLAAVALPLVVVEYYFTRERVTTGQTSAPATPPPARRHVRRAALTDRFWLVYVGWITLFNLAGTFRNISLIYYANYVLGDYNDGVTPTLLALIGGIPLGVGLFVVWPLAKRIGKRNLTLAGTCLSAAGNLLCLLDPADLRLVLTGQAIANLGLVPAAYVFTALLGDVLDTLEWRTHVRADGFTASAIAILTGTVGTVAGAGFNLLLGLTGDYRAPQYDAHTDITTGFDQTANVQSVIVFAFLGFGVVANIVLAVLLVFLSVEKTLPIVQTELAHRHRYTDADSHHIADAALPATAPPSSPLWPHTP